MEPASKPARPTLQPGHVVIPVGAFICALPLVSAGTGLVLGVLCAMAAGNPYLPWTRKLTHPLLSTSVVFLGAAMDLRSVLEAGLSGVGYTVAGITVCLTLGWLFTRWWRVPTGVGALISVGTAICGGSAIAAMVPVLRSKEQEVSVALATVFLLNAVALVLFPPVGHLLHLSQTQFGLWCALAIHDTSSVVGASMTYGTRALEIATTVKLARALWIVPVTFGAGLLMRQTQDGVGATAKPKRPWFILGFLAAAAVVTAFPALRPTGRLLSAVARQALVVTLFLIGAGLSKAALKTVGLRPFALGLTLWLGMGTLSLGAILVHLIQ